MVSLIWANKLRERIKEFETRTDITHSDKVAIGLFIAPIMSYADSEENRITIELAKPIIHFENKDYNETCKCSVVSLEPCDYCLNKRKEEDWAFEDGELDCEDEKCCEHPDCDIDVCKEDYEEKEREKRGFEADKIYDLKRDA